MSKITVKIYAHAVRAGMLVHSLKVVKNDGLLLTNFKYGKLLLMLHGDTVPCNLLNTSRKLKEFNRCCRYMAGMHNVSNLLCLKFPLSWNLWFESRNMADQTERSLARKLLKHIIMMAMQIIEFALKIILKMLIMIDLRDISAFPRPCFRTPC
jgi:UDP-2,3-diacylglucosamine pyrophosphatase LpxH